jgi:CubicO group peptidase (beta-lactamase class C family)
MIHRKIKNPIFFVLFLIALCLTFVSADQKTDKVDALFSRWDKNDSPGCALAVIQDGEIIYKKGYGMANLELDVPISPRSVFYIGSTSKQFVTMCIALLAQEGKLSLDDDIRKYIPEMPDYGTPITVRHLIHHTSGIRDYLELVGIIAGLNEKRMDEMIGIYHQPDSRALIARQKELNFKPGEKFLYSNSCYLLLAEIVGIASESSLREYADKKIFKPLGMTNTHFHDDYTQPIKNRATGYYPAGKGKYRLFLSTFDCVGSGGLFSCVEDLYLWDQNFYHHKVGGKEVQDMMHTRGKLNSGEELDYAFALMHGEHKGLRTVRHGGALGGYRAELVRFPEQRFSVICLSNLSSFNPSGLCNQVADIYLADKLSAEEPEKEQELKPVSVNPDVYDDYAGKYRLDVGLVLTISREEDNLIAKVQGQPRIELIPVNETTFLINVIDAKLSFQRASSGKVNDIVLTQSGMDIAGKRIEDVPFDASRLPELSGDYYSDELDVMFTLLVKEDKLYFANQGEPGNLLRFLKQNEFAGNRFKINFLRDNEEKIVAFTMNTGRVKNLKFVKK